MTWLDTGKYGETRELALLSEQSKNGFMARRHYSTMSRDANCIY